MSVQKHIPAFLLLEDGSVLQGVSFGAQGEAVGRLVFNTACVGYQQLLTDPDSEGQVIVDAFPCVGNYGVNDEDSESARATARGMVVREWCDVPSNFRSTGDIDGFMKKLGVVGLCGVDTRALVRAIRDKGACGCMICTQKPTDLNDAMRKIKAFSITKSIKSVEIYETDQKPEDNAGLPVALVDFGCKRSFLASLAAAGMAVRRVPFCALAERVAAPENATFDFGFAYEGVVLSPGPEDLSAFAAVLPAIATLYRTGVPLFAVGLGHLLLAKALEADIASLPHGHRGQNIPVTDSSLDRTAITTQNHGLYVHAVKEGTITHRNPSDGTCEGIRYDSALSVQFIPVYEKGSMNTGDVFREYQALCEKRKETVSVNRNREGKTNAAAQ